MRVLANILHEISGKVLLDIFYEREKALTLEACVFSLRRKRETIVRTMSGALNKEVPAMRAAKMKERPSFQLMVQTDVQSIYHMQMPRWLFSDSRYCEMSLDAKVTYTFLLNRFQLSRRNGWVNERGEVFVIFPRKALAKELRISSSV